MAQSQASGYLPGDPRYGLSGEPLRRYYRDKPAQWMIIAWDAAGKADVRAAHIAAQKHYASALGERLIGYGHIVSNNAAAVMATTWFVQLDDRAAAEAFVADDPLSRAGVYEKIDIRRWSNSFLKRAADYTRKGMQQYLCAGSKIPDAAAFFAQHLRAHESYFKTYEASFVFRGPLRSPDGTDNVGTALLLELPDRAAAEEFWNNEPFAAHGGYQDDSRIYRWVFGD
ncbi:MAG: YciI family protein [Betaproteobacteria bacterium]